MNSRDFFRNFDGLSVIKDFVFRLFWKDLSKGYKRVIKWDLKYWNAYYHCVWLNFAWKMSIWTTRDFRILCRYYLVMTSGGYVFYGNWLLMILKSILENYGYEVDLALLRRLITLCPIKGTFFPISFYRLIKNIWRW